MKFKLDSQLVELVTFMDVSKRNSQISKLQIGGTKIKQVQNFKYLKNLRINDI